MVEGENLFAEELEERQESGHDFDGVLATLASSLTSSLRAETDREAAVLTFVIAASGVAILGIGSAFWALVAGLMIRWVLTSTPGGR